MSKNYTKKFLLIPFVMVSLSGLVACANDNNRTHTQTHHGTNPTDGMSITNDGQRFENPYNHNYNGDYDGVQPHGYTMNDVRSAHQVATRANQAASQVPGVTRATAIAEGIDIVVGIDVAQGTDKKLLEEQVRKSVTNSESGYNVYVTSDSDIHFRIRKLFTNMNNVKTSNVMPGIGQIIYDIGRANHE